jgi:hypothetical protein
MIWIDNELLFYSKVLCTLSLNLTDVGHRTCE